MGPGARTENIGKQSLTDEQRRPIAKELQPFGLEPSGRLALLLLGHVGTRGHAPLSRRASQPDGLQRGPLLFMRWVSSVDILLVLFCLVHIVGDA